MKNSTLIRSLPDPLSFLCTVASTQPDMTVEALDALISAELERQRNPNNLQGLNRNMSITAVTTKVVCSSNGLCLKRVTSTTAATKLIKLTDCPNCVL